MKINFIAVVQDLETLKCLLEDFKSIKPLKLLYNLLFLNAVKF